MKRLFIFIPVICIMIIIGCSDNFSPVVEAPEADASSTLAKPGKDIIVCPALTAMNERLAAQGAEFRVAKAEWITDAASGQAGQTVYANNRALWLGHHWVPGDPNRGGRTNIMYYVDILDGGTSSGLTATQTEAAIDRAMATWAAVDCADIPIIKIPVPSTVDLGYVEWLITGGTSGAPFYLFDITHGGWLPAAFFESLTPGGGNNILGVTFTFVWVDAGGNRTDMDNNGKEDVAFREIYYNDNFPWGIDAIRPQFDVESIALHEAGHGVSLGHFGKLFRTDENGMLHFAPRAVMNALYYDLQQTLLGTDIAAFSTVWGSWPMN